MTQRPGRDFWVNVCSPCPCRQLHPTNPFIVDMLMIQNIFPPRLIVDRLHSKQLVILKRNHFVQNILDLHLESKTVFKGARKVH